ncbi:hypothetical protein H5410_005374 [Solanum commersonii]|uniref:Uncharacterized protein n=1 Tax=Solanum commersonii TaxID=4109 RepID=A0A9J6A7E4_SOLCO|nr:hypothetical protein H5410_005374 [Solanum commersonii]
MRLKLVNQRNMRTTSVGLMIGEGDAMVSINVLEGMTQVGTLFVTSDASQTRVGGSHTLGTQPAAVVAPHLVKGGRCCQRLKMIRREGFEQYEGKKARHSGEAYIVAYMVFIYVEVVSILVKVVVVKNDVNDDEESYFAKEFQLL